MPELNLGTALLVYGPLGITVALFVFGFIFSKSSMDRERSITDRLVVNNEKIATTLDRLSDTVLRGPGPGPSA